MAELFRFEGGEPRRSVALGANENGRDVLYDYAEAEVFWNDSEPTAPGPVGVPAEARADSIIDGEATSVVIVGPPGRGRSASLTRGFVLAAAMIVVVAGIARWAAGQRPVGSRAAAAAAVATVSGSVAVAAPSVPAARPIVEALPPPAPVPPPAPPDEAAPVSPPSPLTVVARGSEPDGRAPNHHRSGSSHHHARRVEALAGATADGSDGDPGPRLRRARLRPIDVVDPFAP
jgi:hypothetical protein